MDDLHPFQIATLAYLLVGGPAILIADRLQRAAIDTIRKKYPEAFAVLGRLPVPSSSGPRPAREFPMLRFRLRLLVSLPESLPDDAEVLRKLKWVQLIVRTYFAVLLPLIVWGLVWGR